jgi:phage N-6-adenine-methyltransferase
MENHNTTTPEGEGDLAQTPVWFVEALQKYLQQDFDLDVCALARTAKCKQYYSLAERGEDALKLSWAITNFCNPPYSDIKPWIIKAGKEAMSGSTTAILIPDKPETDFTRTSRRISDTIIHMPFRLRFLRPDGTEFLDPKGKKQGPKFAVAVHLITPHGLKMPVRDVYVDFRSIK